MELILSMALESTQVATRMAVAMLVITGSTLGGLALDEKYVGEAYIPVKGDVYTIGYGTTKGVKKGDRITPERALIRLLDEVENVYGEGIKKCIKVPLYQREYDAYLRLSYNVGVPTFCRTAKPGQPPNLIDLINAQRYDEACVRIDAFNKGPDGRGGKKVLAGLVKRRAEERAICEGKDKRW
jgi:lysozyme